MGDLLNTLSAWAGALPWQTIGMWVSVILTLVVFSYLLGDNPLYRLVEHLFVGASVGYAAVLVWHSILAPRLQMLLADPDTYWYYGLFLAMGLMLLLRSIPAVSCLANIPLAFLFGVGAALAVGGALAGSLVPQLRASLVSISPNNLGAGRGGWTQALNNLVLALSTICVLLYFYFSRAKKGRISLGWTAFVRFWGGIGKWIILVTFGALFAHAVIARVALLIARLDFLLSDWLGITQ